MARHPHRLDLYRQAVQHPDAEVEFVVRAYRHYRKSLPTRLREDFAGTAAVAAAFVAVDDDHRALAVEKHGPTARWAERRAARLLKDRAGDLPVVQADVLELASPKVDVVCALNFSTFIYHERKALLQYLRHARRCLSPGGVFVMDLFGGPGAMRPQMQHRLVEPVPDAAGAGRPLPPFEYVWEQRRFDHRSARIDCRIHFVLADGTRMDSAFRYDWRLWTPAELHEILSEAGFRTIDLWCDEFDPVAGFSDGVYRPRRELPAREDFVACMVALK